VLWLVGSRERRQFDDNALGALKRNQRIATN
jgi:hypothetical protein